MPLPAEYQGFDIAAAGVSVWVFKKSGGAGGSPPSLTGRWVATDEPLDLELRAAVQRERDRIEEVIPYGLLAQNNEASALTIGADETHAALITAAAADALPSRRARALKQLRNSDFYVIKLTAGGVALYAVRKADASWKTKKRLNAIDALFRDETLTLEPEPSFTLSRNIDFFILGNEILILNKGSFESVLNYRQAHANDFQQLQTEPAFSSLFTDLSPLVAYVGTNKIQLRRACAIRAKGHFRDADFMDRLRQHHANYHLNLQFDGQGRIIPTPDTCADIITALLDHRLSSAFSRAIYDVPDAVVVT